MVMIMIMVMVIEKGVQRKGWGMRAYIGRRTGGGWICIWICICIWIHRYACMHALMVGLLGILGILGILFGFLFLVFFSLVGLAGG